MRRIGNGLRGAPAGPSGPWRSAEMGGAGAREKGCDSLPQARAGQRPDRAPAAGFRGPVSRADRCSLPMFAPAGKVPANHRPANLRTNPERTSHEPPHEPRAGPPRWTPRPAVLASPRSPSQSEDRR
ncbi:hypothetical protein LNKW23_39200 [Paralimibaculum aggregatum]|uniref:Uncharacterized protein n=1 Tax=Paralimibaculum aggregatum TaxID=3036245 RepID=A0ABQ6LS29_9RHOB|nr:hypothetical protein LNKW23_39200 [Limibaculum sp. NKW23]